MTTYRDAEYDKENAVKVPFIFFAMCPGPDAACLLAQIRFYENLNKRKRSGGNFRDGYNWIYNSHADWAALLRWDERTVRTAMDKLAKVGLIVKTRYRVVTKNEVTGEKKPRTILHVRCDDRVFDELYVQHKILSDENRQTVIDENRQMPIDENRQQLDTENTTENTTESTATTAAEKPKPVSSPIKEKETTPSQELERAYQKASGMITFAANGSNYEALLAMVEAGVTPEQLAAYITHVRETDKRYEKRPKPLRFVAQDIGPWIAAQPKPKARTIIGALPPPPNMDYSAYEDGAA
jgi:hypothetical protein